MAKNTGGTRKGCVKNRTQYHNEKTDTFMKRDKNGRFMSGKSTPYKSVKKEKSKKATKTATKTATKSKTTKRNTASKGKTAPKSKSKKK